VPDKIEDKEKPPETPEPRWKEIDVIASKMESIFFEECTEKGLSPYEMSVVLNRVNLLFDEYKGIVMAQHVHGDKPNVEFKGSKNIYK